MNAYKGVNDDIRAKVDRLFKQDFKYFNNKGFNYSI